MHCTLKFIFLKCLFVYVYYVIHTMIVLLTISILMLNEIYLIANVVYNNAEERTLMTKSGVHFKATNTVNCKK